jgi:hypothetical protein
LDNLAMLQTQTELRFDQHLREFWSVVEDRDSLARRHFIDA